MEIATIRNRVTARSRTASAERLKAAHWLSLSSPPRLRGAQPGARARLRAADARRAPTRSPAEDCRRPKPSPLRPAMCTAPSDAQRFPSTSHTPGPLPGSKIAPIGTCSAGADRPSEIWMEMVEPSGASARRLQHSLPSLERPSLTVRGVRQLAKCCRARQPASIQGRPAGGSDRRAQGFESSITASRRPACATHDDSGTDDLPRLGQSLDDHAVRISQRTA